jgi:hypothetical protein
MPPLEPLEQPQTIKLPIDFRDRLEGDLPALSIELLQLVEQHADCDFKVVPGILERDLE